MREYRTWEEILIERFTSDWEEAIGYLDVALEEYQVDRDARLFFVALRTVIESQIGIAEVAKQAGIEVQCLSNMLTSEETPRLDILTTILSALGCRLSIQPLEGAESNVENAAEDAVIPSPEDDMTRLELATERCNLR
jgi:DNA-binding phage protein